MIKIHVAASQQYDVILNKGILVPLLGMLLL